MVTYVILAGKPSSVWFRRSAPGGVLLYPSLFDLPSLVRREARVRFKVEFRFELDGVVSRTQSWQDCTADLED